MSISAQGALGEQPADLTAPLIVFSLDAAFELRISLIGSGQWPYLVLLVNKAGLVVVDRDLFCASYR